MDDGRSHQAGKCDARPPLLLESLLIFVAISDFSPGAMATVGFGFRYGIRNSEVEGQVPNGHVAHCTACLCFANDAFGTADTTCLEATAIKRESNLQLQTFELRNDVHREDCKLCGLDGIMGIPSVEIRFF